jgi:lysylphosphatidylglycerol synthetase-like protein (DUF2156 family)
VAQTERLTLPIPYGHRVYVASDLSLSPTTSPESRPVREFIELLGDIDDAGVVVVAGNLFHPDATSDLGKFVDATLVALPQFSQALVDFASSESHRVIVLAGSNDHELSFHDGAQHALEALGVDVAKDLILQVATADGVRDLGVCAGAPSIDLSLADEKQRSDADRLEDPLSFSRFVASRVLYRRLGPWAWLPLVAMVVFDLFNTIAKIVEHFTHRHYRLHAPHTHTFWGNLVFNVVVLIALEAIVVNVAGLIVRRRFESGSPGDHAPTLSEPLAQTHAYGMDALEVARRVSDRGGAGAIVGGAPRPALAFLDRGVCASPGPSRTVLIERRGRFGFPPVFSSVDRFGVVEVEAASTVQVRLISGESVRRRGTWLERLAAGQPLQPALAQHTSTVGSWPNGDPFPVTLERLGAQRRQRSIRRWASGLLFVDGLINVAVTTSPPLRGRLHLVLSVLPLGLAQSAAALTAVAGIAMIMMARGVRRGQRRAWFFAAATLSITIFAHLARGGTILSSLLAAAILVFLVVTRSNFQATTDHSSLRAALPRLALITGIVLMASTLGIEASSGRHHLPSLGVIFFACLERLVGIYNINLPDGVDDFIDPTLVTVGISLLVSLFYVVTRPVVDRRLSQKGTSTERRFAELRAREIVRRHGRGTLDYFALRDDKQFFFFRDSLVAYAVYGGVALISPDPIGPEAERTEVFSAFRSFGESRGWTIGVMAASAEWTPIYHAAGMHYIYLGDEAIVDCQTFSLEGGKMKGLRQACTRLKRHGYSVSFLDPSTIDPADVTDILELISMLRRGEDERGFSMMLGRLFNPKDKGLLLTVVHGPDGKPAAVCQFVPSPALNGFSLDLMRRDPGDHPNGLIDFALCSTIEYLAQRGARGLSLNFAAFRSVLDGERGEGAFTRIERWALKRLSGVLPIETLWTFNAKYNPTWLARYIVYPAAESFVPVVAAILRAESITELPVFGRLLSNDPSNRPGTVVPQEVLDAARLSDEELTKL